MFAVFPLLVKPTCFFAFIMLKQVKYIYIYHKTMTESALFTATFNLISRIKLLQFLEWEKGFLFFCFLIHS